MKLSDANDKKSDVMGLCTKDDIKTIIPPNIRIATKRDKKINKNRNTSGNSGIHEKTLILYTGAKP